MQRLEDFLNNLTDQDWGWWPVLFLRPRPDQNMDNLTLLRLTCYFGLLGGLLLYLVAYFILKSTLTALVISAATPIIFFIGYKCTFAFFWNRRARRLRSQSSLPPKVN